MNSIATASATLRRSQGMHIAQVFESLSLDQGGPTQIGGFTGAALSRLGHRTSFWSTRMSPNRLIVDESDPDVHLYEPGWPRSWLRAPALAQDLEAQMHEIDIVHAYCFWSYPIQAAVRAAHRGGKPSVVYMAGALEPWRMQSTFRKHLKKQGYLRTIGRRLFQRVDCLHIATEREAQGCRDAGYTGSMAVIPHGVDPALLGELPKREAASARWPELRDRRVVLFLSRISAEKGIDLLIPAWARLRDAGVTADSVLVIAGPDDRGYGTVVGAMLEHYDLVDDLLFPGPVVGTEKLELFACADLFVLPSYSENFGIVVPEALAAGVPVVTTTGTPWQILEERSAGRWVEPTVDHLVDAMRDLLALSDADRASMGARGRDYVEQNLSWDSITKTLVELYEYLLGDVSSPRIPACVLPPTSGPEH